MKANDCPKCGAPVDSQNTKKCSYCGVVFVVEKTSQLAGFDKSLIAKFKSMYAPSNDCGSAIEDVIGLAVCHMAIGNYSIAKSLLERTVVDHPLYCRAYYLLALSIIGNRKIKNLTLKEVKEVERLILVAVDLNEMPEYWMLLAIVRYQYYRCNGLRVPAPDEDHILSGVKMSDDDRAEVTELVTKFNINDPRFNRVKKKANL